MNPLQNCTAKVHLNFKEGLSFDKMYVKVIKLRFFHCALQSRNEGKRWNFSGCIKSEETFALRFEQMQIPRMAQTSNSLLKRHAIFTCDGCSRENFLGDEFSRALNENVKTIRRLEIYIKKKRIEAGLIHFRIRNKWIRNGPENDILRWHEY